jgi:nitrite reductase/ring-hydroxylating ferredoxin subunit/Fe-S cluster biogenesis protein NfuA
VAASTPALTVDDFELLASRVDEAIAATRTLDPGAQTKANALKSAIEAFHKVGLTKIVQGLKADPRGRELLMELASEPAVYALFSMHGLIRADIATRVSRVIDMVRPLIESQGGAVEFDSVEENVAFVRIHGTGHGCNSTLPKLKSTVEDAIHQQVPEIERIEVIADEPEPVLVQILGAISADDIGWTKGPATSELRDAKPFRWEIGEFSVLLLRFDGRLQAFRNACAHQGLPLDGGIVDIEARTITCPWHGFRFDCQSGECLTAPQAQLETLPVRVKAGHAWVRCQ